MNAIYKSVLRKLWNMRWRSIAFSLVIALAVAMLVSGLYSSLVFDHSIDTFIEGTNFPDVFVQLSDPIDEASIDDILSSSSTIDAYSLRLKADGIYHNGGETYPAIFIGIDDPTREDIARLVLKQGRFFEGNGTGVVVAGMESIGAEEGSELAFSIGTKDFRLNITGSIQTTEYLFFQAIPDSSLPFPGQVVVVFMGLEDLQAIVGPGINDMILIFSSGSDSEDAIPELEGLPISHLVRQRDHPSIVFMDLGAVKMKNMFPLLSSIFMVIGMISIFMTFYRIVMNDSRYIGVMMSLGYSKGRIVASYMAMGAFLALIGSILGFLFSLLFTYGVMSITMTMVADIDLAFPIDPMPFLIGALYAFGSVLVSIGIPVIVITRQSVREALDHKPRTRVATLGTSLGGLSTLKVMALRNTFRNPPRTALTVLVIGMSIGMAGSWLVITDSSMTFLNEQVDSDTWDIRADFNGMKDNDNISLILDLPDAEYVIPFAFYAGSVEKGGEEDHSYIVACDDMAQAREFELQEGNLDLSGAVITNKLAKDMGLKVGDSIRISVGPSSMMITITGIVYDILGHTVYLDRNAASQIVEKDVSSGAFIKLDDKQQVGARASEIRMIPGISRVTVQDDISRSVEETFGQAMSMLWAYFLITLLIALVIAGSAIIISTMERDLEYATLETLGIKREKVIGTLVLEVIIIGLLSSAIGVPMSFILGKLVALVMEEILYTFPILFAMSTILLTFFLGTLFVLGSSIFPIRYTAKLNVERTIRERTAA